MKNTFSYLKSIIVDGFLVILPVVIVGLIFAEIYAVIYGLADAVEALLPVKSLGGIDIAIFLTVAIILLICLIIGLIARTKLGQNIGSWFEKNIFMRLPGYKLLKSLSDRFTGAQSSEHFKPGVFKNEAGVSSLVLIVEELEDDTTVIFIPLAPTPGVGNIQVVPRSGVKEVDIPMGKFMDSFLNLGIGAKDIIKAVR